MSDGRWNKRPAKGPPRTRADRRSEADDAMAAFLARGGAVKQMPTVVATTFVCPNCGHASLKNAAAREAADSGADPAARPTEAVSGEPAEPPRAEAGTIETALASGPDASPDRYHIRENADGWSVYDSQTKATAETYGYRLTRMNRSRAESLVEVLNRGEARKRGRNG
jgi:hypothetical protein